MGIVFTNNPKSLHLATFYLLQIWNLNFGWKTEFFLKCSEQILSICYLYGYFVMPQKLYQTPQMFTHLRTIWTYGCRCFSTYKLNKKIKLFEQYQQQQKCIINTWTAIHIIGWVGLNHIHTHPLSLSNNRWKHDMMFKQCISNPPQELDILRISKV